MSLPTHLKNRRSQAVAIEVASGLAGAQPPHVSIEGGRFTLVDAGGNKKPLDTVYLDCIIIATKAGRNRVFWGKGANYEGENQGHPICFSDNNIGASINAQQPQAAQCTICEWSKWDSDISKLTGKNVPACKTFKKIGIMLPGFTFPFQMNIPVMSHPALESYSAEFKTGDYDVSDVITRISFVAGKTGQLAFDFADFGQEDLPYIDGETMKLRDDMIESGKTDILIGRNDVPWSGALPAAKEQQVLSPPKPAIAVKPTPPLPAVPQTPQRPVFGAPQQAVAGDAPKRRGRPPKTPGNGFNTDRDMAEQQIEAATPSFGIQDAAAPSNELEQALDQAFKLPT